MNLKQTLIVAAIVPLAATAQMEVTQQTLNDPSNAPLPCFPVPSERQIKWNETEFYAFFHYGMNTYTDLEWGDGTEAESKFAPTKVPNPRQWLTAIKEAGMKGGIAVVKHHDGFCLWPTKTTTHSVINESCNDNAKKTNIPKDFGEAARDLGLKYGFYVSPWDRNSRYWGKEGYTTNVFIPQCEELAQYGNDQFEMWFDGATGGGGYYGGEGDKNRSIANATTYYDIPNLRARIHRIAPNCVMWGVGGEARWIGNEAGWAGETNWLFGDKEYGDINAWQWHPGESDAKFTSGGWFWHPSSTPNSAERTFQMYLETVGRNATLILNCPPDRSGELPENQVTVLKNVGKLLHERLWDHNYAPEATIEVSEERQAGTNGTTYSAKNLVDNDSASYWATNDTTLTATITLTWTSPKTIRYVELAEPIRLGQRIKSFTIEYSADGSTWTKLGGNIATTTVGYKRIIPLNGNTAKSYGDGYKATKLRIKINDSRACPLLSNLRVM